MLLYTIKVRTIRRGFRVEVWSGFRLLWHTPVRRKIATGLTEVGWWLREQNYKPKGTMRSVANRS